MEIVITVRKLAIQVLCVSSKCYCLKTRLFFCGWMNSSMIPPTMEFNRAFTDSRLLVGIIKRSLQIDVFAKKCSDNRMF